MSEDKAAIDGVKLALLNNRLEGITRKMASTLLRTGRSGVLNIARDFSCCIVTADCELLCTHEGLPIHVLSGPDIMARVMKEYHPDLKRGDAFLNNSPYHGCSHAADHTLLIPVIDDDGVHRFTVVIKAHQADIGNSIPTTYHGSAQDVYEEGALIFPSVKVQESFETNADFVRMCQMRIRVPEQWWGDFLAMVGAARIGETELMGLANEFSWDELDMFSQGWLDYSERLMIDALGRLPSGHMVRESCHDPFPGTPDTGIPVKVEVKVNPQAAQIEIDLTDNIDCLPCGLNLSEACSRTAAMIGVFNSIDHSVPKNAGSFRRIQVALRENCVVGIPNHPTSTSVSTTNVADRVANAIQGALADIGEGIGLAECGAVIPPAVGVVSGVNPRNGESFVNQIFLGMTGGAGAPQADAWITIGHVGNAGLCFVDSIELDELRQPIHVYERTLIEDTEGAGRYKGAPSVKCVFGPVGCDVSIGFVSDGTVNAPMGARGGDQGGKAAQYLVRANGEQEEVEACTQLTLCDNDKLVSISCGGGGYGPATDREPEVVAKDVRERWITPSRALSGYGVVVDDSGELNVDATAKHRANTK